MGVPADYPSRPAQVNVTHRTFGRTLKESRVMGRILENFGVLSISGRCLLSHNNSIMESENGLYWKEP